MVSTVVTIGLMIVAFIGIIVSVKIQKTNPNAKILAFVCLLVILGCAVKYLADEGIFGGETREEREMRLSYMRRRFSIADRIGSTYAASFKGKKVVIVAPNGRDFNKQPGSNLSFQNEIQKAFDGASVVITGLDYKPSDSPAGMEEIQSPKLYDKLFTAHKDAALVIFTISIPVDTVKNLSVWGNKNAPKIILIETEPTKFLGAQLTKKNTLLAMVTPRPNLKEADYRKIAPSDLKKAFDEWYLLITKDNAAQLSKTYKNLFL